MTSADDLPLRLSLHFEFAGELWYWRGPSPYHFVTVPDEPSAELRGLSPLVSYGWGVIPVKVRIGNTSFETSLFPRQGRYALPVKDAVRFAEALTIGDAVSVEMDVQTDVR